MNALTIGRLTGVVSQAMRRPFLSLVDAFSPSNGASALAKNTIASMVCVRIRCRVPALLIDYPRAGGLWQNEPIR